MTIERSMPEILAELEAVQQSLKGLGITPEQIQTLQQALTDYTSIMEEILKARDTQFSEDSYHVLTRMKAYTGKNGEIMSRFLRQFAEHIVQQSMSDSTIDVADIVDHLLSLDAVSKDKEEETSDEHA
jgi:hypothetical protein